MISHLLAATLLSATALQPSDAEWRDFAADIGVEFTIVDNHPTDCPAQASNCFLATLSLTLPADMPPAFATARPEFYYSYVGRQIAVDSGPFENRLINGDLNVLSPKAGTKLKAGETYTINIWGAGQFFSAYYPMPNIYAVLDDYPAQVLEASRAVIDPDTGLEYLPFVTAMTDETKLATSRPDDDTQWLTPARAFERYAAWQVAPSEPLGKSDIVILPTPNEVSLRNGADISVQPGLKLRLAGLDRSDIAGALEYLSAHGVTESRSGFPLSIRVGKGENQPAESSSINVRSRQITINAADVAGASHALHSLGQQIAHGEGTLPQFDLTDAPRFGFRGLHLDISRNYHSPELIIDLIDQMAVYKLNTLHLHLGDDEGWRLDIPALPELADVGGKRCHDPQEERCLLPQLGAGPDANTPVNGALSGDDYLAILKAAKARHIDIIPSFDMPGHSRAAIMAMEARYQRLMREDRPEEAERYRLTEEADTTTYRSIQNYDDNTLNVCLEATYSFVDVVLDEVVRLHDEAGLPLQRYHIGADETAGAWSESPSCKALMADTGMTVDELGPYFIQRVASGLAARGVIPAGWSDGMGHTDPAAMPQRVQTNIWGGLFNGGVAEAHRQANEGWDTIISIPDVVYFDIPYAPDPLERGYDWPSRGTDTFKVFGFMPENLAANASTMKDITAKGREITDTVPLTAGHSIDGLQAQLWSETVRSDEQVQYMLFPRLIALAERAWHRAAWEPDYVAGASYRYGDGQVNTDDVLKDWQSFSRRLAAHLPLLASDGVFFRLAPPGVKEIDGHIYAETEFPTLTVEWTDQSGDGSWNVYDEPVPVKADLLFRTRGPAGRVSRAVAP
ncbi:family 20 glycosylhydrolase [Parvularcula sp. LCG005]|uniref:family 20 glycosylhydrolase n=1 Tax=Parvularcula sp. LCG005 TaxID=3078805 RepID=UPI002941FD06|nr:family 20 glycosylhydrolase [Parvularcula sp. LCG005]WOI53648.1 family 20 glycosylhydrolase [Parvularcula sp. LCG005]